MPRAGFSPTIGSGGFEPAFCPTGKRLQYPAFFNWFKDEFDKADGVKSLPVKYASQEYHNLLAGGNYEISYLPYNWGINDQSYHGKVGLGAAPVGEAASLFRLVHQVRGSYSV